METITSKSNDYIKFLTKLMSDKNFRLNQNKFVSEGYRCVKDSLPYLINPVLLISSEYPDFAQEFDGCKTVLCSDEVFRKVSDTVNAQGILAVSDIKKSQPDYVSIFSLFLDGITDPGNMGTILRTAVAVGFDDVYVRNCVDVYSPKVVRSAMSAVPKLNIYCSEINQLDILAAKDYTVLCADMDGKNIFEIDFPPGKFCLTVGGEANGVTDEVKRKASLTVSLPMNNIESLNAAVSAAVLMYEIKY